MIVTPDWRASVTGSGGPLAFGVVPGVKWDSPSRGFAPAAFGNISHHGSLSNCPVGGQDSVSYPDLDFVQFQEQQEILEVLPQQGECWELPSEELGLIGPACQ